MDFPADLPLAAKEARTDSRPEDNTAEAAAMVVRPRREVQEAMDLIVTDRGEAMAPIATSSPAKIDTVRQLLELGVPVAMVAWDEMTLSPIRTVMLSSLERSSAPRSSPRRPGVARQPILKLAPMQGSTGATADTASSDS